MDVSGLQEKGKELYERYMNEYSNKKNIFVYDNFLKNDAPVENFISFVYYILDDTDTIGNTELNIDKYVNNLVSIYNLLNKTFNYATQQKQKSTVLFAQTQITYLKNNYENFNTDNLLYCFFFGIVILYQLIRNHNNYNLNNKFVLASCYEKLSHTNNTVQKEKLDSTIDNNLINFIKDKFSIFSSIKDDPLNDKTYNNKVIEQLKGGNIKLTINMLENIYNELSKLDKPASINFIVKNKIKNNNTIFIPPKINSTKTNIQSEDFKKKQRMVGDMLSPKQTDQIEPSKLEKDNEISNMLGKFLKTRALSPNTSGEANTDIFGKTSADASRKILPDTSKISSHTLNSLEDKIDGLVKEIYEVKKLLDLLTPKTTSLKGCEGKFNTLSTAKFKNKTCSKGNEIDVIVKKLSNSQIGGYFGVGGTTSTDLAGMLMSGGADIPQVPIDKKNYTNTLIDTLNKLIKQVEEKGMKINDGDKNNLHTKMTKFAKTESEVIDNIRNLYILFENSKYLESKALTKDPNGSKKVTPDVFSNPINLNADKDEMKKLTDRLAEYKKTESKLLLTIQKLTECLRTV